MRGRLLRTLSILCWTCGAACGAKPAAPALEATIEAVKGSLEVGDCAFEMDRDTRCRRFVFMVKNTGPGCADATTLAGYINLRNNVRTTNLARWELDEKDPVVFAVGETRRAKEQSLTLEPGNHQLSPFEITTQTQTNVPCQ